MLKCLFCHVYCPTALVADTCFTLVNLLMLLLIFLCRMTRLVDDSLQLSHTYGIHKIDFGHAVIFFVLNVILSLIDGTLEDWGLQFMSIDKTGNKNANEVYQVMDIDAKENSNYKRHEHREQLQRANSLMALEVVEKITANAKLRVFLRLIHFNMYAMSSFFIFSVSSLVITTILLTWNTFATNCTNFILICSSFPDNILYCCIEYLN